MIELTPLRTSDAAEMVAVLADPALYEFIDGEPPTQAELERRYAVQSRGRSPDGAQEWLNWIVREGEQAVGFVQATIEDGVAEVAWVIGVPWQGRGVATEAVRLMLAELRSRGVVDLVAHVHPDHDASSRIAERAGLRRTEVIEDGEVRWQTP